MAALLAELVAIPHGKSTGEKINRACADALEKTVARIWQSNASVSTNHRRTEKKMARSLPYACWQGTDAENGNLLFPRTLWTSFPAQNPPNNSGLCARSISCLAAASCDMKGGIVAMVYAILAPERKLLPN